MEILAQLLCDMYTVSLPFTSHQTWITTKEDWYASAFQNKRMENVNRLKNRDILIAPRGEGTLQYHSTQKLWKCPQNMTKRESGWILQMTSSCKHFSSTVTFCQSILPCKVHLCFLLMLLVMQVLAAFSYWLLPSLLCTKQLGAHYDEHM